METNVTFMKLLLPNGSDTSLAKLEQNYQFLSTRKGSEEKKQQLQAAYEMAKQEIAKKRLTKMEEAEDKLPQTDKKLVETLKPSIQILRKPKDKVVKNDFCTIKGPVVAQIGTIHFQRPNLVKDELTIFGIQYANGETMMGISNISIHRIEQDVEYAKAVLALLDKDNVEKQQKKDCGYIGTLYQEDGQWKVSKDPEELAACIAAKEKLQSSVLQTEENDGERE